MKYEIYTGNTFLTSCDLKRSDASMGVASAVFTPNVTKEQWKTLLLKNGAEEMDDCIEIRENPALHFRDSQGCKVNALFCHLQYYMELNETVIDACGIGWEEYQNRFGKEA